MIRNENFPFSIVFSKFNTIKATNIDSQEGGVVTILPSERERVELGLFVTHFALTSDYLPCPPKKRKSKREKIITSCFFCSIAVAEQAASWAVLQLSFAATAITSCIGGLLPF